MLLYPTPLEDYPSDWIDEVLRIIDAGGALALERKRYEELVTLPSLRTFYERRAALIDVPWAAPAAAFPETPFSFLYMIPKKQHEIRKLAPLLDRFSRDCGASQLVDIGGGIGLLAQSLTNHYDLHVTSVDLDPVMQKTGRERNLKNAVDPRNLVDYRTVRVALGDEAFADLLTNGTVTVGLHTCGDLAVAQLEASNSRRAKGIVNFGCCYHKLKDDSPAQNVSDFARAHGKLHLSQFALTLASRAHLKLPEKDHDFKLKVKNFRYAIHFLLHDLYGHRGIVSLGNSPRQLYDETFSVYAKEQLQRLGLTPPSDAELDAYFESPRIQNLIRGMLAAGIIRDALGRPLELYLLLDRALYLEERGYEVELLQCFDEIISPRNLGLFARLPG